MTSTASTEKPKFPASFWTANIVELFERSAYYAIFIGITLYLTNVVGFNDIWAAWIGGVFSAGLYFLPPFAGAYADRIGFRKALLLAFGLLSVGYFFLGLFPYKAIVLPSLVLVMLGGSFIKSVITGTVAVTTDEANRARGYSIFYAMVNVGSFLGKTFAYPIRLELGLEAVNYYSAALCFIALAAVFFYYKGVESKGEKKSAKEIMDGMIRVVKNTRLVVLILIITGFWIIFHQLYATMPKYVIRLVGQSASPEWIANVNPLVVVTFVIVVNKIMKKYTALSTMTVGMFIMPVSALIMAASPWLTGITGTQISIFGFFNAHPVTVMMIIGIVFQALAECFISPRYLEFFSLQAPKGEEGLYLGFGHLHSFLASLLGFGISGYLLTMYCPDPATLTAEQALTAYDNAYMIWVIFAGIGLVSALALILYGRYYGYGTHGEKK